jgi:hypothetical protein
VPIQNGVEAARLASLGGGVQRRVVCTANNSLVIQPLGVVVATVGGTTWAVPHSVATTIDPSALVALAANTRYWVYAQLSGSPAVIGFIVSTDAPQTPGLYYRTGDTSALFVSTFYTDDAANILTYCQSGLDFLYEARTANGGGVRGNIMLDGGTQTVATAVNYSAALPQPQAKMALLNAVMTTSSAGPHQGIVYGNLVLTQNGVKLRAYNADPGADQLRQALVSGTQFNYIVQDNAHDAMYVWLAGFTL